MTEALAPRAPAEGMGEEMGESALSLGCPSPKLRRRWRELAMRELAKPCADHLLGTADVGYHSGT